MQTPRMDPHQLTHGPAGAPPAWASASQLFQPGFVMSAFPPQGLCRCWSSFRSHLAVLHSLSHPEVSAWTVASCWSPRQGPPSDGRTSGSYISLCQLPLLGLYPCFCYYFIESISDERSEGRSWAALLAITDSVPSTPWGRCTVQATWRSHGSPGVHAPGKKSPWNASPTPNRRHWHCSAFFFMYWLYFCQCIGVSAEVPLLEAKNLRTPLRPSWGPSASPAPARPAPCEHMYIPVIGLWAWMLLLAYDSVPRHVVSTQLPLRKKIRESREGTSWEAVFEAGNQLTAFPLLDQEARKSTWVEEMPSACITGNEPGNSQLLLELRKLSGMSKLVGFLWYGNACAYYPNLKL